MKYPKNLYSAEQKNWCENYETKTTFEPLMGDYVAGHQSFYEAARSSVHWFKSWASDVHLQIDAAIPGRRAAFEAELEACMRKKCET
jgi:hypothetical protein